MSPSVQWRRQPEGRPQLYFDMPWTVVLVLPEKVTLVSLLQYLNAEDPMFVTLSGIVTLVRPSHP